MPALSEELFFVVAAGIARRFRRGEAAAETVAGVDGVFCFILPGALNAQRHRLGEHGVVDRCDFGVDVGAIRRRAGDRGGDLRFLTVQRHERLVGSGRLLHQ